MAVIGTPTSRLAASEGENWGHDDVLCPSLLLEVSLVEVEEDGRQLNIWIKSTVVAECV